jgi:TRAP-type C4-dicarboxylate transport system permease small subunit
MGALVSLFERIDTCLAWVIKPIVIVFSLVVAGFMAYGVFMRSLFDQPVFGLEEYVLMAAMWLYMLGAVLASRDRSHLTADFVQVITSNPAVIRVFRILATAVSLGMAILFSIWAFDLMVWSYEKGQTTTVHQLPWVVSQCSLFVASVLFIFYLTRDLVTDFTSQKV